MIKKSLIALSLVISALSIASDNNPNKKHEFKKDVPHEGPIYTQSRSYGGVNDQWAKPHEQPQEQTQPSYRVEGYKIVPTVGVSVQTDCVLN